MRITILSAARASRRTRRMPRPARAGTNQVRILNPKRSRLTSMGDPPHRPRSSTSARPQAAGCGDPAHPLEHRQLRLAVAILFASAADLAGDDEHRARDRQSAPTRCAACRSLSPRASSPATVMASERETKGDGHTSSVESPCSSAAHGLGAPRRGDGLRTLESLEAALEAVLGSSATTSSFSST